MNAYKTYVEVDTAGRVVLEHLPFRAGSLVEVLIVDPSQQPDEGAESLRALFRYIRGLPQSQGITDADIAKEVDDYRSGR